MVRSLVRRPAGQSPPSVRLPPHRRRPALQGRGGASTPRSAVPPRLPGACHGRAWGRFVHPAV